MYLNNDIEKLNRLVEEIEMRLSPQNEEVWELFYYDSNFIKNDYDLIEHYETILTILKRECD